MTPPDASVSPPGTSWPLLAAFSVAGALSVRLDPFATTLAAAVGLGLGVVGLRLWRCSGLPALLRRGPHHRWTGRLAEPAVWVALGAGVGLFVLAVIRLGIEPILPAIGARMAAAEALPLWRRGIIIYQAAVGEELVFRLLLMSAIAAVCVRLSRGPHLAPGTATLWIANGSAALAFGAAHLPSWGGVEPRSLGLSLSVVALNAMGALVLGYVFATRGIVAAMWVHAGADGVIQLLGPLTG